MDSRKLLKQLQKQGWYIVNTVGSHVQLKHDTNPAKVTIPHPKRDLPKGTLNSIYKQAGLK